MQFSKNIGTLRVKQYSKNLLIFAAPLTSGVLFEIPRSVLKEGLFAFIAFCAVSSIAYISNDVLDKKHDQQHASKRYRPIASGSVTNRQILITIAILIMSAIYTSIQLPMLFQAAIVGYLINSLTYSLFLKKIPVIEFVSVSIGFLIRPLAGAFATNTIISSWFLYVFTFGAITLVLAKRYSEKLNEASQETRPVLKEYSTNYLLISLQIAMTSTLIGYSFWALSSSSSDVFTQISVLPLTVGAFHYLHLTQNYAASEKPETLLFKDKILLFNGSIILLLIAVSTFQ